MTVIVLIGAAPGLRGHVARWLVEITAGVFVGRLSARVRGEVWKTVTERIGDGQAVLVYAAHTEQRWVAETAGRGRWVPVDFGGLVLFRRPVTGLRRRTLGG